MTRLFQMAGTITWLDVVNGSVTTSDTLNGAGVCISATAAAAALPGPNSNGLPVQGRCGHGPRLPLLVISPWALKNYIDNTITDQASIIRFIEDTFLSSQRIGGGSFDATAGTLNNKFNFTNGAVIPNPTPCDSVEPHDRRLRLWLLTR